jgi:hypothetical protein
MKNSAAYCTTQADLPKHRSSTTDFEVGAWQLLVAKFPHDPVGVPYEAKFMLVIWSVPQLRKTNKFSSASWHWREGAPTGEVHKIGVSLERTHYKKRTPIGPTVMFH